MNENGPYGCPRDGHTWRVLIIARISTPHQDRQSLDDQAALCQRYVRDRYPGAHSFRVIAGRGSGEYLDRAELAEAEAAVESGRFDLVVVEDIGRVCRRNRAIDFCELCEDACTRLIALNDGIDTAREDWRTHAFFAALKHESYNREAAKRIRRTLRERFAIGQVVMQLPYGYEKPPGPKVTDATIRKLPEAGAVYERVFRMLEDGATTAEVADWLNAEGVPLGRWVKAARWTPVQVRCTIRNPILKGVRVRNAVVCRRVNKTGRRRKVKAPPGERLERHCPHLAFIAPDRYDRVLALLAARGAASRAAAPGRAEAARKRTVWPGQHLTCGVCGRRLYWGGQGQPTALLCAGVGRYACWNTASADGPTAGCRLAAAVLAAAERLPEFDADRLAALRAAADAASAGRAARATQLAAELADTDRALAHLLDAVQRCGMDAALEGRLVALRARRAELAGESAALARPADPGLTLPPAAQLRDLVRSAVGGLAFDDPAFGRAMRVLIPRLEVYPVVPADGGRAVLRARAEVSLVALARPDLGGSTRSVLTVDLFDPPERVAVLAAVAELRAAGRTIPQAAAALSTTVNTVSRACGLHARMTAAGRTDPYVPLAGPRSDDRANARHRHPRYRYDPLPGFPIEVVGPS